jgi:endo-1,4-beta-mannosidase
MPTLFTGHMSGVNWIPAWALGGSAGDDRFRVVSGGAIAGMRLRNWYTDRSVLPAQLALAGELSSACADHPALWAWDLGNENSNCVIPPDKLLARRWLSRVIDAIRHADGAARVTVGLHMEDLEHDRNLGPAEAAEFCDFLTMHGYPGYAAWARSPTDEQVLPFLARVTRWLGGGAEVLFSELGVPTYQRGASDAAAPNLVEEQAAASYVERSLEALAECGCSGAMLWCYSDYASEIWQRPPLDLAVHERSFGLWRADASPKPALTAVQAFAKRRSAPKAQTPDAPKDSAWIDIEPSELHRGSTAQLPRLYQRYCKALAKLR